MSCLQRDALNDIQYWLISEFDSFFMSGVTKCFWETTRDTHTKCRHDA